MEEGGLVHDRRGRRLQTKAGRRRLTQNILRHGRRGDKGGKGGRGDSASQPRHGSHAHPHSRSPYKPFYSRRLRAIRKRRRAQTDLGVSGPVLIGSDRPCQAIKRAWRRRATKSGQLNRCHVWTATLWCKIPCDTFSPSEEGTPCPTPSTFS
ncbi:hypothetical protein FQZ97_1067210 [compost metagenome]